MASFRLKQIGVTLCLVTSLLVGSASACLCSHHQEKKKTTETSCHGTHEALVEQVESPIDGDGDRIDAHCVCFINQPAPFVVSKSESKKVSAEKDSAATKPLTAYADRVALTCISVPDSHIENASYSHVFESLKPSRAPPRL